MILWQTTAGVRSPRLKLKTKIYLLTGTLPLICLAGVVVLWIMPVAPPRLEVTLVSPPKLQSKLAVFYHYGPHSTRIEETQQCYRAELRFKNLGPGQIYFPYRGTFSLEIQKQTPLSGRERTKPHSGLEICSK